jgi:hypothetical protein
MGGLQLSLHDLNDKVIIVSNFTRLEVDVTLVNRPNIQLIFHTLQQGLT